MQPELIKAYRYWRQFTGHNSGLTPFEGAAAALARARAAVAGGVMFYPRDRGKPYPPATRQSDGSTYVEVDRVGLRFIGAVAPEVRKFASDIGGQGWYTLPDGESYKDGSGLCWGVVYQLPGHKGVSRFVAGYVMGGTDDGNPTLDLSHVFSEPADPEGFPYNPLNDVGAARDAAHAADSMAQRAAEEEREYQTAWRAGSRWADLGDSIKSARQEALAILKERRNFKDSESPAICSAVRSKVESLIEQISEAREIREKLSDGDAEDLIFWPGEARLQSAFNDGAGADVFKQH